MSSYQCEAITKAGTRCTRNAVTNSYCTQHYKLLINEEKKEEKGLVIKEENVINSKNIEFKVNESTKILDYLDTKNVTNILNKSINKFDIYDIEDLNNIFYHLLDIPKIHDLINIIISKNRNITTTNLKDIQYLIISIKKNLNEQLNKVYNYYIHKLYQDAREYAKLLLDNMGPNKLKTFGNIESGGVKKIGNSIIFTRTGGIGFTDSEIKLAEDKSLVVYNRKHIWNPILMQDFLDRNKDIFSSMYIYTVDELAKRIINPPKNAPESFYCLLHAAYLDFDTFKNYECKNQNININKSILNFLNKEIFWSEQ